MRTWLTPALLGLVLGSAPSVALPAAEPRVASETVAYPAGKETLHGYLSRPAGKGSFPGLVLVHGDYGLTEQVKAQARRLAGHGYLVLAVDLYRGEKAGDLLEAHILGRGVPDEQVLDDLKAAVDYLTHRDDVRGERLGILGWDMGGGYALDAARQDRRLRAVVTCYGRLVTDPTLLTSLQASVLGIFAGQDEGISPETRAQFQAAMAKAGKQVAGIHVYPDCGHGFLNPSTTEKADEASTTAAADAWKKIDAYLDAELKP